MAPPRWILRARYKTARAIAVLVLMAISLQAADAPKYEECRLDSLFPAGGQAGQTVSVDFFGNNGGLAEAKGIVIDGPPGISVEKIENVNPAQVRATLKIESDAKPGRRMLRVQSDRSGLTNMLYFVVSRLPERNEKEPNHDAATAEPLSLPAIVNGRVNPAADVDCFSFEAKAGQQLVVAVFAHANDSHGQGKNFGLADASLRITDSAGRIVTEAFDTLGLDPLAQFEAPLDGRYTVSVQLVGYRGFPEAVYRLVIGEVPIPTSARLAAGSTDSEMQVVFDGPFIPDGAKQSLFVDRDSTFPVQFVTYETELSSGFDLPIAVPRGTILHETEPNDASEGATPVGLSATSIGEFSKEQDADWYRVKVRSGQRISVETMAQRFLRSPVDSFIQAYDSSGELLAANDDGFPIDYMSIHDYLSPDSRLVVTAPADEEIRLRVTDQAGNFGPRAAYQLRATALEPDFALYQFPDAVPVWGPGSTAAFVVKVERGPGGLEEDVELTVEGLPPGWSAGGSVCPGKQPHVNPFGKHRFLSITAPADAAVGTVVPFRVVGRCRVGDRVLERVAQPMTLYYTSDTGFFRITPVSRAVIAKPQGPWLSVGTTEFTAKVGDTVEVPVNIHGQGSDTTIALVANAGLINVGCGLGPPSTVPIEGNVAKLPIKVTSEMFGPGTHDLVVARSWRSDIRIGMPGPCTPILRLTVSE